MSANPHPPPSPSATTSKAPTLPIHTYHCLCTTLLLATPYTLSTLPRRAAPALDAAIILPLPPPPTLPSRSPSPVSDHGEEDSALRKLGGQDGAGDTQREEGLARGDGGKGEDGALYSMVTSTTIDRKPLIVRREDGFEKRWVWRCGRCRLGVGYSLGDGGVGEAGEKGKVVYLLPGGLVGTRDMREGRYGGDGEIVLGGE